MRGMMLGDHQRPRGDPRRALSSASSSTWTSGAIRISSATRSPLPRLAPLPEGPTAFAARLCVQVPADGAAPGRAEDPALVLAAGVPDPHASASCGLSGRDQCELAPGLSCMLQLLPPVAHPATFTRWKPLVRLLRSDSEWTTLWRRTRSLRVRRIDSTDAPLGGLAQRAPPPIARASPPPPRRSGARVRRPSSERMTACSRTRATPGYPGRGYATSPPRPIAWAAARPACGSTSCSTEERAGGAEDAEGRVVDLALARGTAKADFPYERQVPSGSAAPGPNLECDAVLSGAGLGLDSPPRQRNSNRPGPPGVRERRDRGRSRHRPRSARGEVFGFPRTERRRQVNDRTDAQCSPRVRGPSGFQEDRRRPPGDRPRPGSGRELLELERGLTGSPEPLQEAHR